MTKITQPETHDITVYTVLTLLLTGLVLAAHYFGGILSVYEWRISQILENLQHLNPWVEVGIATSLVMLVVSLLIYGHNALKPYDASGSNKWDIEHEL